MWRTSWRGLLAHKVRLVLSGVAVILGVAFLAGSLLFTDTLERTFTDIIEGSAVDVQVTPAQAFGADLTTDAGDAAPATLPDSAVAEVAAIPGVAVADGSVFREGVYVLDSAGRVIGAGAGPPGLGSSWPTDDRVSPARITSGRPPTADDEVALDDTTFGRTGLRLGDTVSLVVPTGTLKARLVGSFRFGETGGLAGATVTAFAPATAQRLLAEPGRWTSVDVAVADGASDDDVAAAVRSRLGSSVTVKTRAQQVADSSASLREGLAFIRYLLVGFAAVGLLVGGFLIYNTFAMLVAQRSRELALMRALGATRRQVRRAVVGEALVLGVLGSLLGVLVGYLMALGLRALFGSFGLSLTAPLTLTAGTVVGGMLLGVVVTVLSAWAPARRASRVPPVAAMRDAASLHESGGPLRAWLGAAVAALAVVGLAWGLTRPDAGARASWTALAAVLLIVAVVMLAPAAAAPFVAVARPVLARLGGATGGLAALNVRRNPRRTAATASAIMIGLALVVGITVVTASVRSSVVALVDRTVGADAALLTSTGQPFATDIADTVRGIPGVAAIVRQSQGPALVDGERRGIAAIGDGPLDAAFAVDLVSGDLGALDRGELVVARTVAEQKGWSAGSTVTVTFQDGSTRRLRVGAVVEDNQVLGDVVVPLTTYREAGGASQDTLVWVRFAEGADPGAVRGEIERIASVNPLVVVADQTEIKERNASALNSILVVIYALLALSILIAILGVVNTLALSVAERTREIGLVRAIGATRRQVRRMIRWESTAITVLGALLGVVAGLVVGVALQRALSSSGVDVLSIPWVGLIAMLVGAGLVGLVAGVLPARRAARLDVLDAIATE